MPHDIEHLQNTLSLSVTDIAFMLNVSRQAIYKWLSGQGNPESDKLDKIQQLKKIIAYFHQTGITCNANLLKMKLFDKQQCLMDLIRESRCSNEAVAMLIKEARFMKHAQQKLGAIKNRAKPTQDWLSSITIPSSFDLNLAKIQYV